MSKRVTSWLSVPTVLFLAAVGPFVWGLHLVNEALAWIVPSGGAIGLALWQSRAFLVGGPRRARR